MTCKPRQISGNLPFDAISRDYNRYCDRISGNGDVGGFNPDDLNPAIWIDYSDASLLFTDAGITPVSSDGDIVYQANDKSVNGNNIIQTTLAKRPLYKTGIQNLLSVGRFDGVDDFMSDSFALIQPYQLFMVCKLPPSSSDFILDGMTANSGSIGLSPSITDLRFIAGGVVGDVVATPVTSATWTTIAAEANGATSKIEGSGASDTGDIGATNPNGLTLGSLAGGLLPAITDIGEVFIVPSILSAGDKTNMVNYLNNKWNTTL